VQELTWCMKLTVLSKIFHLDWQTKCPYSICVYLDALLVFKPTMLSAQFATLKPTHKLAASAFKYSDWMKVLAASLLVGFCDEWNRALRPFFHGSHLPVWAERTCFNFCYWCLFWAVLSLLLCADMLGRWTVSQSCNLLVRMTCLSAKRL
jgi:hypothetical protein